VKESVPTKPGSGAYMNEPSALTTTPPCVGCVATAAVKVTAAAVVVAFWRSPFDAGTLRSAPPYV
jgi:hypothetical protein